VTAAAVATVLLAASGTTALATTGVLDNMFAAITGEGRLASDSRQAIIDRGFIAETQANSYVSPDGTTLTLQTYYVDNREIGLDFILSGVDGAGGVDIPDGPSPVTVSNFLMEMVDENGETGTWEWVMDLETDIQSRTFPGGYYFSDWKNGVYEYEPGNQDFSVDADATKIDEDTYQISVIATFREPVASISEKMRVRIGDLRFGTDNRGLDAPTFVAFGDDWAYDIDIDSKFTNAESITYHVASDFSVAGVEITKVTVQPAVCRIEANLDFSKNGLGNPESAAISAETGYPQAKYDLMALGGVRAKAGDRLYGFVASSFTEVTDGVVKCWFEVDSMYFDAPETLTLVFEGDGDTVIEVPLTLNK
jgi:hypothetical protein